MSKPRMQRARVGWVPELFYWWHCYSWVGADTIQGTGSTAELAYLDWWLLANRPDQHSKYRAGIHSDISEKQQSFARKCIEDDSYRMFGIREVA
jgi:hypothetical protein